MLALVSCYGHETLGVANDSDFLQLPYAGWTSPMCTTQVFGVLQQAADSKAFRLGNVHEHQRSDRDMDELVACRGPALLRCSQVRQAPGVPTVPARLRIIVIGPV